LLDIALELERIALSDDYFIKRKALSQRRFLFGLDLSVDGTADGYVSVLFAIARTSGWIAQWEEMLTDPEQNWLAEASLSSAPGDSRLRAMDKRK
jgi:citrate synthase